MYTIVPAGYSLRHLSDVEKRLYHANADATSARIQLEQAFEFLAEMRQEGAPASEILRALGFVDEALGREQRAMAEFKLASQLVEQQNRERAIEQEAQQQQSRGTAAEPTPSPEPQRPTRKKPQRGTRPRR